LRFFWLLCIPSSHLKTPFIHPTLISKSLCLSLSGSHPFLEFIFSIVVLVALALTSYFRNVDTRLSWLHLPFHPSHGHPSSSPSPRISHLLVGYWTVPSVRSVAPKRNAPKRLTLVETSASMRRSHLDFRPSESKEDTAEPQSTLELSMLLVEVKAAAFLVLVQSKFRLRLLHRAILLSIPSSISSHVRISCLVPLLVAFCCSAITICCSCWCACCICRNSDPK